MSEVTGALVGRWKGTVVYGPKVEEFTITFSGDGTAALVTAQTTGRGTWVSTGAGTFDFTIKEKLNSGDSGVSGDTVVTGIDHLVVAISAQLAESSFEGSGMARVYNAAGDEIFAIAAQMTARQLVAS